MGDSVLIPLVAGLAAVVLWLLAATGFGVDSRPGAHDDPRLDHLLLDRD